MTASELTPQAWLTLVLVWLIVFALFRLAWAAYRGRELKNRAADLDVQIKEQELKRVKRLNKILGISEE